MIAAACGKRGDPLPPLRPFPAGAEGLTVRQLGNSIHLEWRAPVRNTDGTTEKLELRDVEVRRRIVNLPALIEAQTKIVEPEEDSEEDPEQVEDATDEASEALPGTEALAIPPGIPEPETPEPTGSDPAEPDATLGETVEADDVAEEPQPPPVPILQIGEFAPDSRYVTTLESTEPGAMVTFEEPIDPTWVGLRIQYAVVYTNQGNRRGPRSTAVAIDPVPALVAPSQPAADTGDGFVTLRWDLPEPDSYYSVFRRRDDDPDYPDNPLNAVPIAETEYQDRSVRFHVESCYVIRTVPEPPPVPEPAADSAGSADPVPEPVPDPDPTEPTIIVPEIPPPGNPVRIESEASPEICVVPVDTFPPPAPTGLVAVRSGEHVLLTWTEVERSDVTGYRVYRSVDEDGPFDALTEDPLRVPSFTDETVEAGETYYYAVTTVDDAPRANESPRSRLSEVTLTR